MTDVDPAWYALRDAVYGQDLAAAEALLRDMPALIHLNNSIGETVLHFLAVEDDREGVEWLLSRGADLNTKNSFGAPVLFEVAALEYKELFCWLVEHGADPYVTDREGQTVVEHLIEYDHEPMAKWVQSFLDNKPLVSGRK
jgi:ankyrin repeat protein